MKLEIYRREDGLFAWRLKAGNGRIIATDGGQGYVSKKTCEQMAAILLALPETLSFIRVVDLT